MKKLEQLAKEILQLPMSFDHPDLEEVHRLGEKYGFSPFQTQRIFFAVRDLQSLREAELLDGGDGSETKSVDLQELLEATFSAGEK